MQTEHTWHIGDHVLELRAEEVTFEQRLEVR